MRNYAGAADDTYKPFWDVTDELRESNKRGIVYPSARHSQGYCIALFDDETENIRDDHYEIHQVKLTLISERQAMAARPETVDPFREKVHPSIGHFEFCNAKAVETSLSQGLMHPQELKTAGMIDFTRRQYASYPDDVLVE